MNCYIKRITNSTYFNKNISKGFNHWTTQREARIFDSVALAKAAIKIYNLKNVEIQKIKKDMVLNEQL